MSIEDQTPGKAPELELDHLAANLRPAWDQEDAEQDSPRGRPPARETTEQSPLPGEDGSEDDAGDDAPRISRPSQTIAVGPKSAPPSEPMRRNSGVPAEATDSNNQPRSTPTPAMGLPAVQMQPIGSPAGPGPGLPPPAVALGSVANSEAGGHAASTTPGVASETHPPAGEPAHASATEHDVPIPVAPAGETASPATPPIGRTPRIVEDAEDFEAEALEARLSTLAAPPGRAKRQVVLSALAAVAVIGVAFAAMVGGENVDDQSPVARVDTNLPAPVATAVSPSNSRAEAQPVRKKPAAEQPAAEQPAAEQPALATPTVYLLDIRTMPATAKLTLDGAPITNPYTDRLAEGSAVVVEASSEGYTAKRRSLTLGSDTRVALVLDKLPTASKTEPAKAAPVRQIRKSAPRKRRVVRARTASRKKVKRARAARPAQSSPKPRKTFVTENPY